jgi:hypothetical protein
VFCLNPDLEVEKVRKELEAYGMDMKDTPWASIRIAESMIGLEEHAEAAKSSAAQVKESMKNINVTLRPGEDLGEDLPACLQQLEQVPDRVSRWKNSPAHYGADVALSLTRVHIPKINEERLKHIGVGNPEGQDSKDYMGTFIETASQITSFIDLDTFVKPTEVPDIPEEELVEEEEEKNK